MDAYVNLGYGRVVVAPVPPTTGTTLQLLSGQGARMPAVPFNATAWPITEYPDVATAEIVRVTAVVGDAITIVRAQEGTNAVAIAAGYAFSQTITKRLIDELRNASNMNAGTLPDARLSSNVVLTGGTALQAWPVGSVFIGVLPTNPSTLLGYGTWASFGSGRVLVGVDAAQVEFAAVEQGGGAKTHVLAATEMPSHSHVTNPHTHTITDPGHTHAQDAHTHALTDSGHAHQYAHAVGGGDLTSSSGSLDGIASENLASTSNVTTGVGVVASTVNLYPAVTGVTVAAATVITQVTGAGGAHNNLQPYITVFMWKRTA